MENNKHIWFRNLGECIGRQYTCTVLSNRIRILADRENIPFIQNYEDAAVETCSVCRFRLYRAGGGHCGNKKFIPRSV